jgi:hypothetical protein
VQWDKFSIYLFNGEVEIDNNLVENAIRPTKLGAKNYLFFGSAEAGVHNALLYTLIANSKAHGLDPAQLSCRSNQAPSRRTRRSAHSRAHRSRAGKIRDHGWQRRSRRLIRLGSRKRQAPAETQNPDANPRGEIKDAYTYSATSLIVYCPPLLSFPLFHFRCPSLKKSFY